MPAEDVAINKQMASHCVDHILAQTTERSLSVLTHCNTGSLATAGYGTALGESTGVFLPTHVCLSPLDTLLPVDCACFRRGAVTHSCLSPFDTLLPVDCACFRRGALSARPRRPITLLLHRDAALQPGQPPDGLRAHHRRHPVHVGV